MTKDDYPQLANLFGGYMHQDWDTEGDDWPDLVSNYLSDSAADAHMAATEINAFLVEHTNDAVLEDVLLRVLNC